MSFREEAALRIYIAVRPHGAFQVCGDTAIHEAQLLADLACEEWGHNWLTLGDGSGEWVAGKEHRIPDTKVCMRCGLESKESPE